jgi:hypothetical protein
MTLLVQRSYQLLDEYLRSLFVVKSPFVVKSLFIVIPLLLTFAVFITNSYLMKLDDALVGNNEPYVQVSRC